MRKYVPNSKLRIVLIKNLATNEKQDQNLQRCLTKTVTDMILEEEGTVNPCHSRYTYFVHICEIIL